MGARQEWLRGKDPEGERPVEGMVGSRGDHGDDKVFVENEVTRTLPRRELKKPFFPFSGF